MRKFFHDKPRVLTKMSSSLLGAFSLVNFHYSATDTLCSHGSSYTVLKSRSVKRYSCIKVLLLLYGQSTSLVNLTLDFATRDVTQFRRILIRGTTDKSVGLYC